MFLVLVFLEGLFFVETVYIVFIQNLVLIVYLEVIKTIMIELILLNFENCANCFSQAMLVVTSNNIPMFIAVPSRFKNCGRFQMVVLDICKVFVSISR